MGQENMLDNGDMYVMVVVKLNCLNLEIVFVPALDAAIYLYLPSAGNLACVSLRVEG